MAGLEALDRAIDELRMRLGLRSRLQVAAACTLGAVGTAASLAVVMPLAIVAGVLWIGWELARCVASWRRDA